MNAAKKLLLLVSLGISFTGALYTAENEPENPDCTAGTEFCEQNSLDTTNNTTTNNTNNNTNTTTTTATATNTNNNTSTNANTNTNTNVNTSTSNSTVNSWNCCKSSPN